MIEEVPFLFRSHKDNPSLDRLRLVDGFGRRDSGFSLITPQFFSHSDFYVGHRKTHPVGKIILREA